MDNADAKKTSNGTSYFAKCREKDRVFALQEVNARFPNLRSEPGLYEHVNLRVFTCGNSRVKLRGNIYAIPRSQGIGMFDIGT